MAKSDLDSVSAIYNNQMKVKEIIKMLEEDGWFLVNTEGSHRQLKHPTKTGKLSDEVKKGTLNSILKQAGLK